MKLSKSLSILLLIISLSMAVVGCSSDNPDPKDNNNENNSEQQKEDVPPEEEKGETKKEPEEEKEQPKETQYNLNDTVTLGDWAITVTGMEIIDSISVSQFSSYKPDEGNKYIQVFVKIENKGKTASTFLPMFSFDDISTKLLFGDGYEFTSSSLLGYDNDLHDSNLNPLSTKSGEIVFSVPESVTTSTEELLIVFNLSKDSISYKLR